MLNPPDHPRRCGENGYFFPHLAVIIGSPPQVRGKLRGHLATVKQNGITPAGAGKTASIPRRILAAWDHPRRCGENSADRDSLLPVVGSPPQVRGKLTLSTT